MLQTGRVFDVTDNNRDLGLQFRRLDFICNGVKIGAAAGEKNAEPTVGRLDFGHSTEGWRVIVKFSDPFRRSTLSGERTEVIPYVP